MSMDEIEAEQQRWFDEEAAEDRKNTPENVARFKRATALAQLVVLRQQDDGSYVLDWSEDFDQDLWKDIEDGLWDAMIHTDDIDEAEWRIGDPTDEDDRDYAYYMAWEMGKRLLKIQAEMEKAKADGFGF